MGQVQGRVVLRHIRQLAGADGGDRLDRELLRCYAAGRDQSAFGALVERHGPMVWNGCRAAPGPPQDAEDAFPATFLGPAEKAGSGRWGASVAPRRDGVPSGPARKAKAQAARKPGPLPDELASPDPLEG